MTAESHAKKNNTMRSLFHIDDVMFTGILMQSLPTTWDQFLDAFAKCELMNGDNPKEINFFQFIHKLKNEYYHKKNGGDKSAILIIQSQSSNIAMTNKKPLAKWIANTGDTAPFCKNCKKKGHATNNCWHLNKAFCKSCKRFGHSTANCWNDNNNNNNKCKCDYNDSNRSKNNESRSFKKRKYKLSNAAKEDKESAMCIKYIAPKNPTKNIEMTISPLINEEEEYKLY